MSERGECSKSSSAMAEEEPDRIVVNIEDVLTAVKEGNISFVKTLLEVGAASRSETVVEVDAVPETDAGSTALHQAVAKGLHVAAAAGNDEMLDVLLDLHPNVNIQGERRRTPLNAYALSQRASLHIIKKFLEEGADPNVPDDYGRTCLHTAAYVGNVQMMSHLLNPEIYSNSKMLVDINAVVDGNMTALHKGSTALHLYLSKERGSKELTIIRKFLELGADLSIVDANKRNVLHVAVLDNKLDVVKCLLDSDLAGGNPEKSLDINAADNNGQTALHLAVIRRNHDIVETILDRQPDVSICNMEGDTAFDTYCRYLTGDMRDAQTLKVFLRHGTNPSLGRYGLILHAAAQQAYPDILRCLLDPSNYSKPQYRDPNELDERGFTPLHHTVCSIWSRRPEMTLVMKELLKHGADPNIRTQLGWFAVEPNKKWTPPDINVYSAPNDATVQLVKRDEGLSALHIAVVNGRRDAVEILLANGADVDALDNLGMTALMLSIARFGDQEGAYLGKDVIKPSNDVVKLLLQHGAKVSITGPQGQNSLHTAAARGLISILKHILEASNRLGEVSIINSIDEHGATALHHAVEKGREDAVQVLLDHNADVNVNVLDSRGLTPLILYVSNSAEGLLVRTFFKRGASISMTGPRGQNCLHIAAARGRSSILNDILEEANRLGEIAIINSIDEHGATALHHAVEKGREDAVQVLLDHNADVNVRDNRRMSPLMVYVRNSAVTVRGRLVRTFSQHGASISMTGPQGQNCLHIAAARGRSSILMDILEEANRLGEISFINSIDEHGATALHHAVKRGMEYAVQVLLHHNADVNIRDNRGMSPLLLYVRNSAVTGRLVWTFLKSGASISMTGPQGQNCLHIAAAWGRSSILKEILEEANRLGEISIINSIDEHGATALHHAVKKGAEDAMQVLLDRNADVNIRDNNGKSPLMLYAANTAVTGHLVPKFLERGADFNVLDHAMKKQNLLHVAARSGNDKVVKALLSSKHVASSSLAKLFDVDSMDEDGYTALHLAAENNHTSVLREILDHGPDVNIRDRKGNTPLIIYCGKCSSSKSSDSEELDMVEKLSSLHMVEEFIKHGAQLEISNEEKRGCLHAAAGVDLSRISFRHKENHAKFISNLVELLVSDGVEEIVGVNAIDVHGMTPLHLAAAYGDELVLRRLLNDQANVNLQDSRGKTLLHYYFRAGNYSEVCTAVVNRSLELGANPCILDEDGHNVLHAAVMSGEYLLVICLMEACSKFQRVVDVDAVDREGSTALHLALVAAADSDSHCLIPSMVETLLKYNPSLNIHNKRGETPLQVYRKAGGHSNSEVVKMLKELGAKGDVDDLGQADELLLQKSEKDLVPPNDVEDDTSVGGQEALSSRKDRHRRIKMLKELGANCKDDLGQADELLSKKSVEDSVPHNEIEDDTSVGGREGLSSGKDRHYRRIKQRRRAKSNTSFERRAGTIPLLRTGPQAPAEPHCKPTSSEEEAEDAVDMEGPEWTLRSDALALGFQRFDDPFDSASVLLIVIKSAEHMEITFFHQEGMALSFGVGLQFSTVLLRRMSIDSIIEVQELESTTWMGLWTDNQIGSLAMYNQKQGIEGLHQALQSTDGGAEDTLLSVKNQQKLPILGDLQNYLFPFTSTLSAGFRFMKGSNGSSTSESSKTLNNDHPEAGNPGAGLIVQGETSDPVAEEKSGKFKLTVIVRLNSQDSTIENSTGDSLEIKEHEPELKKLFLEPVLKIGFVYEKDGDVILKTFDTTLDLQFHMDTNLEIPHDPMATKFGWFHNDLGMSLECSNIHAVGLESNVKVNVEPRITERVHGRDQSSSRTKGNQGNLKLSLGQSGIVKGEIGMTTSNVKGTAISENYQETVSTTRSHLPETSFAVRHCGSAPAKLACKASLADNYDAKNPKDWEYLWSRGGVETVPLLAEGQWTVDNTAENPCGYHFNGNRNLYMVLLGEIHSRRTPKILRYLFRKKTIKGPKTLSVTQKIAKTLYIDHSFSYVERLALKQHNLALRWSLGLNPTAPADVCDIIDTVDKSSSSSSSPLSPSSSSLNANIP